LIDQIVRLLGFDADDHGRNLQAAQRGGGAFEELRVIENGLDDLFRLRSGRRSASRKRAAGHHRTVGDLGVEFGELADGVEGLAASLGEREEEIVAPEFLEGVTGRIGGLSRCRRLVIDESARVLPESGLLRGVEVSLEVHAAEVHLGFLGQVSGETELCGVIGERCFLRLRCRRCGSRLTRRCGLRLLLAAAGQGECDYR